MRLKSLLLGSSDLRSMLSAITHYTRTQMQDGDITAIESRLHNADVPVTVVMGSNDNWEHLKPGNVP